MYIYVHFIVHDEYDNILPMINNEIRRGERQAPFPSCYRIRSSRFKRFHLLHIDSPWWCWPTLRLWIGSSRQRKEAHGVPNHDPELAREEFVDVHAANAAILQDVLRADLPVEHLPCRAPCP